MICRLIRMQSDSAGIATSGYKRRQAVSKGKKRRSDRKQAAELAKWRRKHERRLAEQAENRRKLLSKFDKETQAWIAADFAKLGLYQ